MTEEQFKTLVAGDYVRSKASEMTYLVIGNYGDHSMAIRSQMITNPAEWDLVKRPKKKRKAKE